MAQLQITVFELRVAESEAERIERVIAYIKIVTTEFLKPFSFFQGASCILMVVE